jgi:5-methylcytosine-specific restriction enzyme subunit McrC
MRTIVVREYARLTTAEVASGSLDEVQVTVSAFDWLCRESARLQRSGASLVQLDDRRCLRLDNYVGVIETPCGTRIEILPKSVDDADDASASRRILRRMLERCLDLPARETAPTNIQTFEAPLTEWVMRQFLQALQLLVKRGVRFEYHAVREEQRFLRGRLEIARQLRQPPGRAHLFQIEHDIFDADRPENRLLRTALDRVCRLTRDAGNWRLSHELATYLAPVPLSTNVAADFLRWRKDRLLAHYRPVRPWCELILGDVLPVSLVGSWNGCSLLLPMEKLFERYVEACLRRQLPEGGTLTASARRHHLVRHEGESWFALVPDFLLTAGDRTVVLDTKWKRLDQTLGGDASAKYGLSQSDIYQMYAYGQRYLSGVGDVALVYPRTSTFHSPLGAFAFSDSLRLWVMPFDLNTGMLCVPEHFVGELQTVVS